MNKKAFTLVELLAVIVIIGIIATITIPKISNSIENSRKNIAQTSAYGYKKAIEEYILNQKINENKINLQGTYNINNNGRNLYNEESEYIISYNGKSPKNGVLVYNNNELVSGCITIDKYKATISNGEVTNVKKGICQYDRLLTRPEKVISQVNDYIEEIESLNITESGIYSVSSLNNEINYNGELPTDGWVSIVYDETNGNWVWKYSIKYRDEEVISYNGSNQSSETQLANEPNVVLIAGTNAKTAGDEIAIGTEHFYIMENTGTKVIALAKANLNVGTYKNANLTEGIQGEVGINYNVIFSATDFWRNYEATSSPYIKLEYKIGNTNYADIYDPDTYGGAPGENNYSIAYYVLNYVDHLNEEHSSLNITGRLLTKDEYASYKTNYQGILESQKFWLGTGSVTIAGSTRVADIQITNNLCMAFTTNTNSTNPGVRPVIEFTIKDENSTK